VPATPRTTHRWAIVVQPSAGRRPPWPPDAWSPVRDKHPLVQAQDFRETEGLDNIATKPIDA
jgi:hypothetical protein